MTAAHTMTAREYAIASNIETAARAAAERLTGWFTLPEDAAYWDEQASRYQIWTGADVQRRDAIAAYSDAHKEVYGTRPRGMDFTKFYTHEIERMTDDLLFPTI